MKNLQLPYGIACLLCISILFSCQKQELSSQNTLPVGERLSGVISDDPAAVAAVPLMISEEFLDNQIDQINGFTSGNAATARRDRTAPTVSLTNPVNNVTITGTITIQATASDNVGVTAVDFSIDGVVIASKTTSPYSYAWNSSTVASGTHTVTATAKDAVGNKTSKTVQVGVNAVATGDVALPSVTITSPVSGSSYNSGNNVAVAVAASDNVGVSSVSFSVDGAAAGMATTAPYNFSWNSTNATIGTHTLTATARDAAGNSSSNSVLVTISTVVIPSTSSTYPSLFQLMTPPVGDQAGEGACVVFASTYAARSIEQYYRNNASSYSYSNNIFSPEYVYDQIKTSDCLSGTSLITALDFIKNTGVCTWQTMPYSGSNGCSLIPSATQNANAANYKITNYSRLVTTDSLAIKNMLINNHPVIISFNVDQSFMDAQAGFIWKVKIGNGPSHVVSIIGFDDSKHAYKIMNSWGTSWGDAGYSYIDYDLLPQIAFYYSYVIQ